MEESGLYQLFCKLYNEGIPTNDMQNQLGISKSKFWKFYHQAIENEEITPRKKRGVKNQGKYYWKKDGKYVVQKVVDGEVRYFGTYPTEEMAKFAVKLCKLLDWREEYSWSIREKVREEFMETYK